MNATITITLPLKLEQAVAAKAQASGQQLEGYILHVLQKDAELPTLRELFADVRADIQARGITDEELAQDIDVAVNDAQQRSVFIDSLLRETLKAEPAPQPAAPASLQAFLQAMAAGSENAPVLPPEADERAFYYEGQE